MEMAAILGNLVVRDEGWGKILLPFSFWKNLAGV